MRAITSETITRVIMATITGAMTIQPISRVIMVTTTEAITGTATEITDKRTHEK